jgi:ketosteroid isomerase-like protein
MKSVAVVAALVLIAGCDREDEDFTEQDAAAVRAVFDSVVADIRAANWTAWANRFAEDAQFHAANAKAMQGRAALIAWAQGFPPVESFSFENVQVSGAGDLAYGTSAILLKLKDLPPDTSKQLVVLRRDSANANVWHVVAVSSNSDLPLPAPPPPPPARR